MFVPLLLETPKKAFVHCTKPKIFPRKGTRSLYKIKFSPEKALVLCTKPNIFSRKGARSLHKTNIFPRKGTRSLHKTKNFLQKKRSFTAQNRKFSPEKPLVHCTKPKFSPENALVHCTKPNIFSRKRTRSLHKIKNFLQKKMLFATTPVGRRGILFPDARKMHISTIGGCSPAVCALFQMLHPRSRNPGSAPDLDIVS
jgi:hypothetical protein